METVFWGVVVLLSVGWLGICYVVGNDHKDRKNNEEDDDQS